MNLDNCSLATTRGSHRSAQAHFQGWPWHRKGKHSNTKRKNKTKNYIFISLYQSNISNYTISVPRVRTTLQYRFRPKQSAPQSAPQQRRGITTAYHICKGVLITVRPLPVHRDQIWLLVLITAVLEIPHHRYHSRRAEWLSIS